MRIISVSNVEKFANTITPKPSKRDKKLVESILQNIQKNGDSALKSYEKKFGGGFSGSLRVSQQEIKSAYAKVTKQQIAAILEAKKRLSKTETAVMKQFQTVKINLNKTKITKSFKPIQSVGCYIPGGLAKYPSSVVMSVVPAKVAGVKRIVVVSPTNNGKTDPLTIVSADLCGANEIYKVGGAHAIAALSFGTKSIVKVDKIVGPGGPFVTLAKSIVNSKTSIDMIAGPTELGIISDGTDMDYVAVDIISQAEHSIDTFCFVITNSTKNARTIRNCIYEKMKSIPRKSIVKKSLEKNGFIGICKNQKDIIALANMLGPEHLEIITKKPQQFANKINSAGLVLIGKNTPSSASDYLLGSNHILPTNGFGKTRGSLSVLDFLKLNTQLETSQYSLKEISKKMQNLTFAEDLPNHYEAVRSRLK